MKQKEFEQMIAHHILRNCKVSGAIGSASDPKVVGTRKVIEGFVDYLIGCGDDWPIKGMETKLLQLMKDNLRSWPRKARGSIEGIHEAKKAIIDWMIRESKGGGDG